MSLEVVGVYRDEESLYDECKKCISYYSVIIIKVAAEHNHQFFKVLSILNSFLNSVQL